MGYRWYDGHDVVPAYPFGHGLSYATFAYSSLKVVPTLDGFDVSFTLANNSQFDAERWRRSTSLATLPTLPAP